MIQFVAGSATFGLFGFACLTTALTLTACEGMLLWRNPHCLARPSMQIACLYTVFFIWPLTAFSPNLGMWLPDPYAFLMVLGIFVGALILFNLIVLDKTARQIWQRATQPPANAMGKVVFATLILTIVGALIMAGYFRQVPLTQTGLVVALVDPTRSTMAREESLKLIDDEFTKYTFTIFASSIGPLLGVLLTQCATYTWRTRRFAGFILSCIVFMIVLAALSITGARSLAVSTLLAVLLAVLFRRGFRIRILTAIVSLSVVILPAVLITVLREGRGLDYLFEDITGVIVERVFVSPLEVGAAYVHFAQTHGYIGIDAIPKLAQIFTGSPGIDVPNLIGLSYFMVSVDSVNANAGFVPSYFSYFGPMGLALAIICAVSLDAVLLTYRWIDDCLLVPSMAVLCAAMFALLSADFTFILISYGFLIVPLFATSLSMLMRMRLHTTQPAG